MAEDTQEVNSLLKDMNGNSLREGDLVMVLLEKPVLVGFITKLHTPSILTSKDKSQPGIMTVTGTVSIPFNPRSASFLQQAAKLVDPRAENLVNAIADSFRNRKTSGSAGLHADINIHKSEDQNENEADDKKPGPALVTPPPAIEPGPGDEVA